MVQKSQFEDDFSIDVGIDWHTARRDCICMFLNGSDGSISLIL